METNLITFLLPQLCLLLHGMMNVAMDSAVMDNVTMNRCFISLTGCWIPSKISMDDKFQQKMCILSAVLHLTLECIQSYCPWVCNALLGDEICLFSFLFCKAYFSSYLKKSAFVITICMDQVSLNCLFLFPAGWGTEWKKTRTEEPASTGAHKTVQRTFVTAAETQGWILRKGSLYLLHKFI